MHYEFTLLKSFLANFLEHQQWLDNADNSDYDNRVPQDWKASPFLYNDRLQNIAFGNKDSIVVPYQGTFIYQITQIRQDLKNFVPNAKFMVQPQIHSWTKTSGDMFTFGGFREILNAEIQSEAMIAISHGAESFYPRQNLRSFIAGL